MVLNIKKLLGSDAKKDLESSVIPTDCVILEYGTISLYLVVKVKMFNFLRHFPRFAKQNHHLSSTIRS